MHINNEKYQQSIEEEVLRIVDFIFIICVKFLPKMQKLYKR